MTKMEVIAERIADDPNLIVGYEGQHQVIAVGWFAEDDTDVVCTHALSDEEGARACAEALRKEEG